jgi:SSS family solute:Na+ symporter
MRQVNGLDYGVIVFYLALMLGIGLYFRTRVRSALDYFAGGNLLPWWVSGISLYMSTFSAWTFSGAAGFVYHKGYFALIYFATWSLAFFIGYRFTAARWRRARVISPVEYAATRYNVTTQQCISWMLTISSTLTAGITLTAVSKIIASTMGFDQTAVTVTVGLVMLLYTYLGGVWGVAVTDVVQFLILAASTLFITPLSLIAAGGIGRVLGAAPPFEHDFVYHGVHYNLHWLIGVTLINVVNSMSLLGAQRYYSVLDEKAAKRVGLMASLLFLSVPLLFGLPPLAGRIFWPDLDSVSFFGRFSQPADLIYVGICLKLLPNGLIGLFVAAMFAATMSALDTTFNVVSAVVSRDIYKGFFRPHASDRELFLAGKVVTLLVGAGVIGLAVWYASSRLGIFNLMALVVGLFNLPIFIPMAVGLLSRGVARWSALAGVCWGFVAGFLAQFVLKWPIGYVIYTSAISTLAILLGSAWLGRLYRGHPVLVLALGVALSAGAWVLLPAAAASPLSFGALVVARMGAIILGGTLIAFSRLFAQESVAERRMVEEFFRRLSTPVDVVREVFARGARESSTYGLVGWIAVAIGILNFGLLLFPSARDVWLANMMVGMALVACGWAMVYFGRRSERAFQERALRELTRLRAEGR